MGEISSRMPVAVGLCTVVYNVYTVLGASTQDDELNIEYT